MANVVNVTTTNTFEEWRVKSNEVGTAVGDLDELDNSTTLPYATVIDALKGIIAELTTNPNHIILYDEDGVQVFPVP